MNISSLLQTVTDAPYIDNSSILTVGFVMQLMAVVALTWKVAQVNTELQVRLYRIEYDMNNIADKVRECIATNEHHKKAINEIIASIDSDADSV